MYKRRKKIDEKASYNKRWESLRGELAKELASELEGGHQVSPIVTHTAEPDQGRHGSRKRRRETFEHNPDIHFSLDTMTNTVSDSSVQQVSLAPFFNSTCQDRQLSGNAEGSAQPPDIDHANAIQNSSWQIGPTRSSTLFGGLPDSDQLLWDFFGTN